MTWFKPVERFLLLPGCIACFGAAGRWGGGAIVNNASINAIRGN
jgi:hypothetical protein